MAPRRSGLGKGLQALIPLAEEEAITPVQGIIEVPLASISPNPHQPRAPIRDQDLVELAASIQEHGILQPLLVTRAGEGYQLIAGERRWRAARLAGLQEVPVLVKDVAPREMLELALVENLQRADLNPLEEAAAYFQLLEEFGLTQEQIARRVGKSRVAVANTLRLLKLSNPVQEALLAGKISEGHARALLGLEQAEAQEAALRTVLRNGLSVRQTEELVRQMSGARERKTAREKPPETRALESRFREALGTRVNLTRTEKGGRIIIYFYSDEELDALYERIVGANFS
jgi:ParB family chromosome partitioning protein